MLNIILSLFNRINVLLNVSLD